MCSIFERYAHGDAMRFAKELGVLREYIRGDTDVVADIASAFETYEAIFRNQDH